MFKFHSLSVHLRHCTLRSFTHAVIISYQGRLCQFLVAGLKTIFQQVYFSCTTQLRMCSLVELSCVFVLVVLFFIVLL